MKIFLDDVRNPEDCLGYMYQRIGKDNFLYLQDWTIARDYEAFKLLVKACYEKFITITHISFDHDLADEHYNPVMDNPEEYNKLQFKEKTGYDCAKWFLEYYEGFGDNPPVPFPTLFVHSMNPVGTQNIINLFK